MVVMALDHVRDFFHFGAVQGFDPLDFGHTTPAIFLTRLVTHFCAPIFSFLAGFGVSLALARGKSRRKMSGFLVTRGLWLMSLELTLLMWFGWSFKVDLHYYVLATLWALGWSMIALAGLIHLPVRLATVLCVAMIAVHNAFDGVKPETWGAWAWLWQVLHTGGNLTLGSSVQVWVFYPLVPWLALMGLGYGAASYFQLGTDQGRRRLVATGAAMLGTFVLLRLANVYGNLRPWSAQSSPVFTLLSFLDVTKYPPSLDYVLLTIGTGLLLLAVFDRGTPGWTRPLVVFGRVPFFYYLLHIPLIHAVAYATNVFRHGRGDFSVVGGSPPPDAGIGLGATYGVWLAIVLLLYPLCRWFADYKRQHRNATWLTYF